MSTRRYAITGPSGTRCGVYPGPSPLAAMALDAGFASVEEWSAATGVDPERMRVAPVPERGELCILPGGLLGRVCSAPSTPRDRLGRRPTGWRAGRGPPPRHGARARR